jgi:predicted Zn-dependent protease
MATSTNKTGPEYYRRGNIQVWDFVRDQELNFHLGNVIKYVCRAGHKFDDIDDLEKAIHYLQNEVEFRSSKRVQDIVQCEEFTNSQLEEYAKEFDR